MQSARCIRCSDDLLPDETFPDELDDLLSRLEQVVPPAALSACMLSASSQLPFSRQHMDWADSPVASLLFAPQGYSEGL
jgi:hypothetical protein